MKKRISKSSINYIIIGIVVILIISYCKIMLKEYLIISKYEPKKFFIKDEELQALPEEIEHITVYKDSMKFEVPNTDSRFRIKRDSVLVKDFIEKNYIVANEDGYASQVEDSLIEVKIQKEIVTRSSLSRRDRSIKKIIDGAYKNLGRPYIYGDTGVRGFDCSGLTYSLYLNNLGIKLPRSSSSLVSAGKKVNKSDLKPGDIILFNTSGKGISHAGLYIGEGNMIHASSGKKKVVIEDINSKYYKSRYVTARRILQ